VENVTLPFQDARNSLLHFIARFRQQMTPHAVSMPYTLVGNVSSKCRMTVTSPLKGSTTVDAPFLNRTTDIGSPAGT
jgi:hypothetical protein